MTRLDKLYSRRGLPPACRGCGQRLPSNRPRVQLEDGTWTCPDCAYRVEHPAAARVDRTLGKSAGPREPTPFPDSR